MLAWQLAAPLLYKQLGLLLLLLLPLPLSQPKLPRCALLPLALSS
jgi:hypothetical protein